MTRPIAAVSSFTHLNVPRRMACRVMMPKKWTAAAGRGGAASYRPLAATERC
jgi:hypothetical protein